MEELWKDIPGYEGLYQVSTLGRVRSLDVVKKYHYRNGEIKERKHKGRILKPYRYAGGYLVVMPYKNGISEVLAVHRLVAIAFLENPKGYVSVGFKDGDKTNLKLENLKWGTRRRDMTNRHKRSE